MVLSIRGVNPVAELDDIVDGDIVVFSFLH
jgi:hypothetical protein